ncbi:MAG TPA: TAXI family TRAP transporter solute-binding subunit [Burkholderiaceae bacterium]|nr:TAXI family TRAP transporter solute-binding subunit [Burkholderiaceae bacterium]
MKSHNSLRKRRRLRERPMRELLLWFVLPALVLVIGAFSFAARYVDPAPPERVVMASGAEGGAYARYAQRYREILAREGIELVVKPSAGSLDNLSLLLDPRSEVDVSFVQGGTVNVQVGESLRSLGSVAVEAVWVFVRAHALADVRKGAFARRIPVTLAELAHRRIAIGAPGSGGRQLALQMLALSGVGAQNATLLEIGGAEAVEALNDGEADALIIVGAPDAPIIQTLMKRPELRIARLQHVGAYTRGSPFLAEAVLPRGAFDIAADRPPFDVPLVATTANVVVRDRLHPAIVDLLMVAISEVHGGRTLFAGDNEYPAPKNLVAPLHDQAERYYKSGRPWLQRWLPFWVATWIERMAVLLLPLVAVVVPLSRVLPAAWNWRTKRRIFRYYGDLSRIESRIDNATHKERDSLLDELNALERQVASLPVHWFYGDLVYGLRSHSAIVRRRLDETSAAHTG